MMAFRTLIRPTALRCALLACIAGCAADADHLGVTEQHAEQTPAQPSAAIPAPGTTSADLIPSSADLAIAISDGVSSVAPGGTVTYTITAVNAGGDDVIGATVADAFPSDLTCTWTCAGSFGGACTAAGTGNIADVVTLPVGGATIYSATCTVSVATTATQISNTATVTPPGPVVDPVPANNVSTDTDSVVVLPALVVGSKSVSGNFTQGGTIAYTIVLSNIGAGAQGDNPGNEMVDVLPADLTLVSASATSGTAVATLATNTVTWDGSIAANGSVTITIVATINAAAGQRVSNQATFVYDSQGTGTNDASGITDAFPCQD
jgi:uncharacterized repeat protein (TIGR01451 family)